MTDNTTDESADGSNDIRTDGGVAAEEKDVDYLQTEINLLNPTTPFMQDHLRVVWTGFAIWLVLVFGPPTLTFLAPGAMSTNMPILGFPLHYFLIGFGGPTGGLLLSFWYARRRDKLDDKYGIDHSTAGEQAGGEEAAAADGGVEQ